MPTTTIDATDLGATITALPAATVFAKTRWQDAWVPSPYLYCDRVAHRAGGHGISDATFTYHCGTILRPGNITGSQLYQQFDRLPTRLFVRVEFIAESGTPSPPQTWYGILTKSDYRPFGSDPDKDTGDQTLTAVGLEWCLDRVIVDKHRVQSPTGLSIMPGSPAFNREGYTSHVEPSTGIHAFRNPARITSTTPGLVKWSLKQCLEYLIDLFNPWDDDGPTLVLDFGDALDYVPENIEIEGRTLLQVINQLVTQQQGLTWSLTADSTISTYGGEDVNGIVTLHIHSFATTDITLPSGKTLKANPNQIVLDLHDVRNVPSVLQVEDRSRQVEQVRCWGDYRSCIATLDCSPYGGLSANLIPAWTTADEDKYKSAASLTAGYTSLLPHEKRDRNEQFRETIPNVYRAFQLDPDWDGTVRGELAFPPIKADGTVDPFASDTNKTQAVAATVTIERDTRLVAGVDYSASMLPDVTGDAIPAFVTVEQEGLRFDGRFHGRRGFGDAGSDSIKNVYVVADQDAGDTFVSLSFNDAAHYLALNHFDDTDANTEADNHLPQVDWQGLQLTARLQSSERCAAVYPDTIEAVDRVNNQDGVLTLRFGSRARMDYIAGHTVFEAVGNGTVRDVGSFGRWLRNDWQFLRDTARLAFEWHSQPRVALSVECRQLSNLFRVGDMVASLARTPTPEPINSLITSVELDFVKGTTSIGTGFVESLDFAELI